MPSPHVASKGCRSRDGQLVGQLVSQQHGELRQGNIGEFAADVLRIARSQNLGVQQNEPAINTPGVRNVACRAQLDATDSILAFESIRRVRSRYSVIRASVLNVCLEQGSRRKQTLIEKLPLGSDFDAARFLGGNSHESGAEPVVLWPCGVQLTTNWALCSRVSDIKARNRDRLVDESGIPAE